MNDDTQAEALAEVVDSAEISAEPDLTDPVWLDAAWVALALPSGSVTREYLAATPFEDLPTETQADAAEIVDVLYPEEP